LKLNLTSGCYILYIVCIDLKLLIHAGLY